LNSYDLHKYAVAASNMNRQYIGIEKGKEYIAAE